ncbi:hypothetical protein TNCV_1057051 [Trichonephila clavipes]|nr:hypothetical protein TNCV_1057051 [Trichonephila clavipes]
MSLLDVGENDEPSHSHLDAPLPVMTGGLCAWQRWIVQIHHEQQHNRFSLLRIIQCPLVPFDAVCSRVECPQCIYYFLYP